MFLKRNLRKQIIISIIKLLVISITTYLLLFYIFGFYIVKSNNMNPSFKSGSLLIYYRLNKEIEKLDVVIVKGKIYRVIGTYKDEIDIANSIVLVNGMKEEGDVFFSTYKNETSNINYPLKIGKDEYFVLNDYRKEVSDSREFGLVKKAQIEGKIIGNIQIRDF